MSCKMRFTTYEEVSVKMDARTIFKVRHALADARRTFDEFVDQNRDSRDARVRPPRTLRIDGPPDS